MALLISFKPYSEQIVLLRLKATDGSFQIYTPTEDKCKEQEYFCEEIKAKTAQRCYNCIGGFEGHSGSMQGRKKCKIDTQRCPDIHQDAYLLHDMPQRSITPIFLSGK